MVSAHRVGCLAGLRAMIQTVPLVAILGSLGRRELPPSGHGGHDSTLVEALPARPPCPGSRDSCRNLLDSPQGFGTLGSGCFPVCQMTTGGLIFMGVSWGAILGLGGWCVRLPAKAERDDGQRLR